MNLGEYPRKTTIPFSDYLKSVARRIFDRRLKLAWPHLRKLRKFSILPGGFSILLCEELSGRHIKAGYRRTENAPPEVMRLEDQSNYIEVSLLIPWKHSRYGYVTVDGVFDGNGRVMMIWSGTDVHVYWGQVRRK